jgi:hypothetical protein
MWHQYQVELYPHFPGLLSGIHDQCGNELPFPSAFRLSRRDYLPKGIVQIVKPPSGSTTHAARSGNDRSESGERTSDDPK